MDSAISNALKKRTELRSQLAEIDQFLALYDKFKSAGDAQQPMFSLPESNLQSEEQTETLPTVESVPSRMEKGWSKEVLRPHILAVIEQAGRPLSRGQVLRALDREGILVGGGNRPKNMGTILWRLKDTFVNIEGHGYWPRSRAYPQGGYEPQPESQS